LRLCKAGLLGLVGLFAAPSALAADGGFNSWPYEVCEEWRPDAGFAMQLDPDAGPWLVPHRRMQLTTCRLRACEEAVDPEPQKPTALGYVLVGGVALLAGVVAGVVLARH
jgi:hypothetical protein